MSDYQEKVKNALMKRVALHHLRKLTMQRNNFLEN